ncbi:MAG: glucokinase [Deltaproteobacteria bacterium]|nr:glucokinase [Deltaproteobacteria bacterium]
MLLAGDIGGTKSRLAIFEDGADPRRPLAEEVLPSGGFPGIGALIRAFLKMTNRPVDRACLAVAGPVVGGRSATTNLPWIVEAGEIGREFGFRSVRLVNDLAATVRAVPLLEPGELRTLCPGAPDSGGVIAVIAPGTGLGEAFLTREGERWQEHATEGGHTDFGATSPLEEALLRELRKEFDHVSYERVCSGPAIPRLYRFFEKRSRAGESATFAARLALAADPGQVIVEEALARKSGLCVRTIRLFCSILGAEAGNLALKTLSTGGVYIGGGIAPRLLPYLEEPGFAAAFRRKGRMAELLSRMPLRVILEPRAALIGAASFPVS